MESHFQRIRLLSVFMWLYLGHLLMVENLFHRFGTVFSSALIRCMAEGYGSKGWISGAVVSLKWARPSELLIYIALRWLPTKETLESHALEFIEGHDEKLTCDMVSLICAVAHCLLCLYTVSMLELSVKKSFFPLGNKHSSPFPILLIRADTEILILWVWTILSLLFFALAAKELRAKYVSQCLSCCKT